jgi:hypothetical protein
MAGFRRPAAPAEGGLLGRALRFRRRADNESAGAVRRSLIGRMLETRDEMIEATWGPDHPMIGKGRRHEKP